MTEDTLPTLEERVARLRANLNSSPQVRETMKTLAPTGMVQTDRNIVDFSDWEQRWDQQV